MTDTSGAQSEAPSPPPEVGGFGFDRPGVNPKEVAFFHRSDDVDQGEGAHHHTLGEKRGQAASGLAFKRLRLAFEELAADFDEDVVALVAAYVADRPAARNLIPNARGRVNQMGSTSGTSLALNAFFLDVWRSLTSTNAVTWTGSDDTGRVITVPASEEVRAPVVERRDVIPDDHLLINFGTSQARVYNAGGSAPALAEASVANPLAVTLDGAANVYVEFGPGTIDRPLLIRASEWHGYFPDISHAQDLAWVQRFYQRIQSFAGGATALAQGWMANSTTFSGVIPLITEMRATPTLSGTAAASLQVRTGGTLSVSAYSIGSSSSGRMVQMDATTSSGTQGDGGIFRTTAVGHYIELDARL